MQKAGCLPILHEGMRNRFDREVVNFLINHKDVYGSSGGAQAVPAVDISIAAAKPTRLVKVTLAHDA